jgi:hypothetical protein
MTLNDDDDKAVVLSRGQIILSPSTSSSTLGSLRQTDAIFTLPPTPPDMISRGKPVTLLTILKRYASPSSRETKRRETADETGTGGRKPAYLHTVDSTAASR